MQRRQLICHGGVRDHHPTHARIKDAGNKTQSAALTATLHDVMRAIKHTLDPTNILNPGKVL